MNEQENAVAQQPEQEVEELEIQVTDQPTETAEPVASSDDELDNYTKSVSKRINKLNERHRAAEEKAARLEAQLRQKEQENAAYVQNNLQTRAALIQKEEEAIEIKEVQANDLYKKAVESNDAELMSKADTLKSDLSIQKKRLEWLKHKQMQPFKIHKRFRHNKLINSLRKNNNL